MVYCGKASLGCQNCRTRRIKCDKVKPECSQCIRVGKKCPGYRDQLSLMFRDESSKVMQKAHAQWGLDPAGEASSSSQRETTAESSGSSSGSSDGAPSPVSATSSLASTTSRTSSQLSSPVRKGWPQTHSQALALARSRRQSAAGSPIVRIDPTWEEMGVQFYINHYVLGLPDEPPDVAALSQTSWVYQTNMQRTMAAVGLAGLANLRGSSDIASNAQKMYGAALKDMGQALVHARKTPIDLIMRHVLMLAMFEIVKGNDRNMGSGARTHIVGAAGILRSLFPVQNTAAMGLRGLLQLCYALLLSCIVADISLPDAFADWINLASQTMPPVERPATELLPLVLTLVGLAQNLRGRTLVDGSEEAVSILRQLLDVAARMETWEGRLDGKWLYRVCRGDFPPQACFRGFYHVYSDNWTARIWNNYRWARLLTSSLLVDFSRRYPATVSSVSFSGVERISPVPGLGGSSPSVADEAAASAPSPPPPLPVVDEAVERATILRMAEDLLISVPTHWKHPSLTPAQRIPLMCVGGAGTGASGIPSLLFQIDVAASAPGVPPEFGDWTLGILDAVWAEMGIVQARSLSEGLRHRHEKRIKKEDAGISGADSIDDSLFSPKAAGPGPASLKVEVAYDF